MENVRRIEVTTQDLTHPCFLIREDGSVWAVLLVRWWDIATWLWWWLCPSDKKSVICMRLSDGLSLRCPARRIATKYFQTGRPR